jgi:L-ascorbate oxidase
VPLPVAIANVSDIANHQNGYCTIAQWRGGQCNSVPVITDIPFSQLGEFVYHCHILAHEDGGMMAKIQVVPSPF